MTALAVTPAPDGGKVRVMTPSAAADRFLADLTRDGRAASTLHRYRTYLDELADLYPHADVEDLSQHQWMKWLDRIVAGRNGRQLDVDTISQRVTIAKQFSRWLRTEEIVSRDYLERVRAPRRKNPVENDKVVWVSDTEARRMLAVAEADIALKRTPQDKYRKILCLGVLCYTGGRRGAVSELRIGDYDPVAEPHPLLTFHEKGGKTIRKPVARKLAEIIREAGLAGVWNDPADYLVPGFAGARNAKRDARIIYRLVKEVAQDAKVDAHVHAMRAAFACLFLENNPDQLKALKDLMGHSSTLVTEVYVRRLDRQKGMAAVVDLDWGQESRHMFQASDGTEKEGFEPSFPVSRLSKPNDCPTEQP